MFRNLRKVQKFAQCSEICTKIRNLQKVQKFAKHSEICAMFRNLRKVQKFAKSKFRNLRKVQVFAQSSKFATCSDIFAKFRNLRNEKMLLSWHFEVPHTPYTSCSNISIIGMKKPLHNCRQFLRNLTWADALLKTNRNVLYYKTVSVIEFGDIQ